MFHRRLRLAFSWATASATFPATLQGTTTLVGTRCGPCLRHSWLQGCGRADISRCSAQQQHSSPFKAAVESPRSMLLRLGVKQMVDSTASPSSRFLVEGNTRPRRSAMPLSPAEVAMAGLSSKAKPKQLAGWAVAVCSCSVLVLSFLRVAILPYSLLVSPPNKVETPFLIKIQNPDLST